ncbi:MAG TPA: hypothetical protein DD471_02505, partial [Planctomycetes bacterium]|nr:hypothetical protein [Planctomycetota bacterium]
MLAAAVIALAAFEDRLAWAEQKLKTEYVVLITIDGLRNEELFGGADSKLVNNSKRSGAESPSKLKKKYWRET